MQENKNSAIKLFGKRIPLQEDWEVPAVSGDDVVSQMSEKEVDEDEREVEEVGIFCISRFRACACWSCLSGTS